MAAGVIGGMVLAPSAYADPEAPPAPVDPVVPGPPPGAYIPPLPADPAAPAAAAPATPAPIINYGSPTIPFTEGDAPGQSSQPFTGEAPFLPPSFNPVNGSMV
ncbi:hypothetical protein RND15_50855, partial [Streptomyces sp. DSM 41529]|nr:hypothetical protein [Streptomyces sp. DSM 41529]